MRGRLMKRQQISTSLKFALLFCFILIFLSLFFWFHFIECGFCRLQLLGFKWNIVRTSNLEHGKESPSIVGPHSNQSVSQSNCIPNGRLSPESLGGNVPFARGFSYWFRKFSLGKQKGNESERWAKALMKDKKEMELQIDFERWDERTCEWRMNATSTTDDKLEDYRNRKFIFVISLAEQLSKSRRHLAEVAYFAKMFNRTLILPRVGNSRIGITQNFSYCAYFDESKLGKYVNWITEEFYLKMIKQLHYQPSPAFLCVKYPNRSDPCFGGSESTEESLRVMQFSNGHYPNRGSHSNATNHSFLLVATNSTPSEEEKIISSLLTHHKDVGILFYKKNKFKPSAVARGPPLAHVEFSPYLHQISEELIARYLAPRYVAVHLRFEYIATFRISSFGRNLVHRLASCAHSFVSLLNTIMEQQDGPLAVYIASDVSDGPPAPNSGLNYNRPNSWLHLNSTTMVINNSSSSSGSNSDTSDATSQLHPNPSINNQAHGGSLSPNIVAKSDTWFNFNDTVPLEVSYEAFQLIKTSFAGKTLQDVFPRVVVMDGGIQGVLDKLICAKADYFVSGSRKCGGGGNFERQILKFRQRLKLKKWFTFT